MQKTAPKHIKYSRNESILKIGHLAKAIAHAKARAFAEGSVWVKNKNSKNMPKLILQEHYSCSVQKNRSKRHQIFQKWEHFENRPSCKGYSLCKMVSLGQKLKMPKIVENQFYKNIRVVLCKKPLQKTPNIREMGSFNNWPFYKGYTPCKAYSLCKMITLGQKLKMPKVSGKRFILKIGHLAKAIAHAKAIAFATWSVWVKY